VQCKPNAIKLLRNLIFNIQLRRYGVEDIFLFSHGGHATHIAEKLV